MFAEFHRRLATGGHLLLAFQVGDQPRWLKEAFGRTISLKFHRFMPDQVADLVAQAGLVMLARLQAGLVMLARLLREPDDAETAQQAFLLARRVDKPTWVDRLTAAI